MSSQQFDLVVIGGGPGGYVAAIRAAQLGLNVACVEKESTLGGTCLRVGCIPSKALLESSEHFWFARSELKKHGVIASNVELDLAAMLKRKDQVVNMLTKGVDALFKKNKITRYIGHGRITEIRGVEITTEGKTQSVRTTNILIATGSKSTNLPGVDIDGTRITTSTEALTYDEVPEHLVVIGAGYIGLELGSVWHRLGSRVTVLEYLDRILPGMDTDLANEGLKLFTKQGLEFRLGSKVLAAKSDGSKCTVECEGKEPLECDKVLVAVGRTPNTEGLGLETLSIELGDRGIIPVDDHFATTAKGIFAIGDVIRGPMLAHKAEEEGVAFAEQLVRGSGHVNYDAIPGVVYTHPEIASVGKSETELQSKGIEYRKGTFGYRANGRARAIGATEGFVKILADPKTDRLLGVHILGAHAGELINEAAVAISFAASAEDLARSCHAHPTLGEILKEAALAVDERAVHS